MRAFMNWLKAVANRARAWWNSGNNWQNSNQSTALQKRTAGRQNTNNHQSGMTDFWVNFWEGLDRLADNIFRAAMIGLLLYAVNTAFCPGLSEKFPTIYGWYTGCTQFVEFAMKTALRGLYSLFTGHWSEFVPEFQTGLNNLLQQFTKWVEGCICKNVKGTSLVLPTGFPDCINKKVIKELQIYKVYDTIQSRA